MFEYAKRRNQFELHSEKKIKKTPRRYEKINRKKYSRVSSKTGADWELHRQSFIDWVAPFDKGYIRPCVTQSLQEGQEGKTSLAAPHHSFKIFFKKV